MDVFPTNDVLFVLNRELPQLEKLAGSVAAVYSAV